jgi:hypothetical protein
MKRCVGLIGFIILCFGCATLNVTYDYDPEFDFSRVETYDWMPIPEKSQFNELTVKHIKLAVNRELGTKGLRITSDNPQILIAIHGGKETRVDVQEWGYAYDDRAFRSWGAWHRRDPFLTPGGTDRLEYRRGTDTYEYEVGTLIIDFVDASKKSLIWRGAASGVVDPGKTSEQVNESVRRLLENFPPGTKK